MYNFSFTLFINDCLYKGLKKSGAYPGFIRAPIIKSSKQQLIINKLNNPKSLPSNVKKVVYTCVTGGYDNVSPLFYKPDNCDFILFTDNPKVKVRGWHTVLLNNPLSLNPILTARMHKILPHRFLKDYDYTIWMDGSYDLIGDITELFSYVDNKSMALFSHVLGDNCITEEAVRIKEIIKNVDHELINLQTNVYINSGLPANFGLFETGILVRKTFDPLLIETMERWWAELQKYSHRDQISLPYVLWKTGLDINIIKGNLWKSELFIRRTHLKEK